jgi:hypothetical protein
VHRKIRRHMVPGKQHAPLSSARGVTTSSARPCGSSERSHIARFGRREATDCEFLRRYQLRPPPVPHRSAQTGADSHMTGERLFMPRGGRESAPVESTSRPLSLGPVLYRRSFNLSGPLKTLQYRLACKSSHSASRSSIITGSKSEIPG